MFNKKNWEKIQHLGQATKLVEKFQGLAQN